MAMSFAKAEFVRVSITNHKVMPKLILEDRLDRQSIHTAKHFFSLDVQKELCKNGDNHEADFVHLVRNCFQACDERGINAYTRVRHLQEFSEFQAVLVNWDDWLPPYNYIQGMPVPTYEAITRHHYQTTDLHSVQHAYQSMLNLNNWNQKLFQ